MNRLGMVLLGMVLLGCGPKVKSYAYLELPPLSSDQDVAVFSETLPECAYEQVGLIASDNMEKTLDQARTMGADGVIGTVEAESASGGPKTAVCGTPRCVTFNTVAIRFSDPTCRH